MSQLSRRDLLVGAAAIAAAAHLPTVTATTVQAPAEIIPAWIVGTPGEFDWQHVVAKTQREAFLEWLSETGNCDFEEECTHEDYHEGCDCCEAIGSLEAERKPMWDGRRDVTPGDWLRSGTGHICSRCSYETFSEEGGHGVGHEAVCAECMTLADWDLADPEHAAELRALALPQADSASQTVSQTVERGTPKV